MYDAIMYKLCEKSFRFLPGATFEELHLSIEVEWGDWHIHSIDVAQEHPGTQSRCFFRGE